MSKYSTILLFALIGFVFVGCSKSEITVHIVGRSSETSHEVLGIHIYEIADSLDIARTMVKNTYASIETVLLELDIEAESISINGSNTGEMGGQYFLNRDLQVIIPEEVDMDVLIERVTSAGAAGIHSPWGMLDPSLQGVDLPLGYENILAAAWAKAEAIAAASNGSLGNVLSIEELHQYGDTVMFRITYELLLR